MKAPSVTTAQIEAIIGNSEIHIETVFDKVTLVSIKLPNGFVLTESSGAVSKENYDKKIGTEICMSKIRDQIWKLEGYYLQTNIAGISVEPDPLDGHSFSYALKAVKNGHRIARAGWNGKGMFVYHVGPNAYPAQTEIAKEYFGPTALVPYGAYLALKGVDDTVHTWVPSISDTLAEDWEILD